MTFCPKTVKEIRIRIFPFEYETFPLGKGLMFVSDFFKQNTPIAVAEASGERDYVISYLYGRGIINPSPGTK